MNKKTRKIIKNKAGVSAVIGVILMVAITVAIAATVYVYISGMLGEPKEDIVLSQIDIDDNYTFVDMDFKRIWNLWEYNKVEIRILDFNNASLITVMGFLYCFETEQLAYNNNSDLIQLKEKKIK